MSSLVVFPSRIKCILRKSLCSYIYFIFSIVLVIICWVFINHVRIDCGLIPLPSPIQGIQQKKEVPPKEFTHGFLLDSYMGQRIQHINCECFDSIPNGIGIKGLAIHYFFIPSCPDFLNSKSW